MAESFYFRVGGLDLASYLRVAPGEGLDPADPDHLEPTFTESPVAEGGVLLNVTEKNREMVWPVVLSATTKQGLHDLIGSINRELAGADVRVAWRDDGADEITYYDLEAGRLEVDYNFRRQQKFHANAIVRVWVKPYGHTATEAARATIIGSFTAHQVATLASLAGDVGGQIVANVRSASLPALAGGRVIGLAHLKHAGHAPWIPAASMLDRHPQASLGGASGAPGSQAILTGAISGGTTAELCRFALAASPYAGAQRIFAIARPARLTGMGLSLRDSFSRQVGATGVASALRGWGLADLGVVRISDGAPTQIFSVGAGYLPQKFADDGGLNISARRGLGDLAGLLVLPEEDTHLVRDPVRAVGANWFGASGASPAAPLIDELGNAYIHEDPGGPVATTTMREGASGMFLVGYRDDTTSRTFRGISLPDVVTDVRDTLLVRQLYGASDANRPRAVIEQQQDSADTYSLAVYYGMPSPALEVTAKGVDGVVRAATLPLEATSMLVAASCVVMLQRVKDGESVYANLVLANASRVGVVPAAGATSVAVACVGIATAPLRPIAGRPIAGIVATHGPQVASAFMGVISWSTETLRHRTAPGDHYALDGPNDRVTRTSPASAVQDLTADSRGQIPQPYSPTVSRLVAFSAPVDGGAMNDHLAVDIKVRERFVYAQ